MTRAPLIWAGMVGFGLSGFFDGILLHQILQWHHLLSLVQSVDTLQAQVVWDGLFHVLMYALTAAGLWGLWRAHRAGRLPGALSLAGGVALGFGVWHFVDMGVFHWFLEIHHIRLDTASPVAWDIGWFVAFGILPALAGWAILRRARDGGGGGGGGAAFAALAVLAVGGGLWAGRVPEGPFAVVFHPGAGLSTVLAALDAADARLVAGDPHGGVVVVEAANPWSFYRHGAIMVGGAGLPAGCTAWSRV